MKEIKKWLETKEEYLYKLDFINQKIANNKKENLIIRDCLKNDEILLLDFLAENKDFIFNKSFYFLTKFFIDSDSYTSLNALIQHNGHSYKKNKYLEKIENKVIKKLEKMFVIPPYGYEINLEGIEYLFSFKTIREIVRKKSPKLHQKILEQSEKSKMLMQYEMTDKLRDF